MSAVNNLRAAILDSDDIEYEDVEVPEWGGITVRVRGLTGTQRDAFEAKMVAVKKGGTDVEMRLNDFRSRLLVKCLVDPATEKRIFEDADAQHLGCKSARVINRLFDVAEHVSGMGKHAAEDARGNSRTVPSDGSTTG